MKTIEYTTCQCCGSKEAVVFEDYRYRGLRGACFLCDGNWPES